MAAVVNNLPPSLQNLDPGVRMGDIGALVALVQSLSGSSTQDAVTASTTQTQAGGTVLRASITRVTVANSSDAVTLGFTATPGRMFTIINDSGQTINLFPAVGDKLNDAAANAAVSIADNTSSDYYCPVANKWFGGATTLET